MERSIMRAILGSIKVNENEYRSRTHYGPESTISKKERMTENYGKKYLKR